MTIRADTAGPPGEHSAVGRDQAAQAEALRPRAGQGDPDLPGYTTEPDGTCLEEAGPVRRGRLRADIGRKPRPNPTPPKLRQQVAPAFTVSRCPDLLDGTNGDLPGSSLLLLGSQPLTESAHRRHTATLSGRVIFLGVCKFVALVTGSAQAKPPAAARRRHAEPGNVRRPARPAPAAISRAARFGAARWRRWRAADSTGTAGNLRRAPDNDKRPYRRDPLQPEPERSGVPAAGVRSTWHFRPARRGSRSTCTTSTGHGVFITPVLARLVAPT